jgi:hypothetical protein
MGVQSSTCPHCIMSPVVSGKLEEAEDLDTSRVATVVAVRCCQSTATATFQFLLSPPFHKITTSHSASSRVTLPLEKQRSPAITLSRSKPAPILVQSSVIYSPICLLETASCLCNSDQKSTLSSLVSPPINHLSIENSRCRTMQIPVEIVFVPMQAGTEPMIAAGLESLGNVVSLTR